MAKFLNILLPKVMVAKDLVNGSSEVLTFNDKPEISGYVPGNNEASRFKVLALMSDGSFRLLDKKGNEIAFNAAGDFKYFTVSHNCPMVKSVSAELYQVKFEYTIDPSGQLLIANAHLWEEGKAESLYAINYEYDNQGRLCKASNSKKHVAKADELRKNEAIVAKK